MESGYSPVEWVAVVAFSIIVASAVWAGVERIGKGIGLAWKWCRDRRAGRHE